MKRYLIFAIAIVFICLQPFTAILAQEPGSLDDPVVTKSYVENLFCWQTTALPEGQTTSLDLGAEIIVRTGTVKVIGSTQGGLIDLTSGKMLENGETIPLYHLIISPESDGRAIQAETKALLLIKGLGR